MLRRATQIASLIAVLAAPAAACPTCSVGQGVETLMIILGFLLIPYVVVSGVLFWMRKLMASE